ncbi:MAG: hypothetical protein NWR36_01980 [Opitutales bacterium]|nr:hypothetical protein [Opitutales bacterium]
MGIFQCFWVEREEENAAGWPIQSMAWVHIQTDLVSEYLKRKFGGLRV